MGGGGLSAFPQQVNLGAPRGLRDPQVRMPFSAVTSSFSFNAGEFGSKWQLGGNPQGCRGARCGFSHPTVHLEVFHAYF